MRKDKCSKCRGPMEDTRVGKQAYCKSCHAAFMRATRPKHSELAEEARKKANARSYVKVYVNRGKVKRLPCEICGCERSEAHHSDYNKPLDVTWLCRDHHLQLHAEEKRALEVAISAQVRPPMLNHSRSTLQL